MISILELNHVTLIVADMDQAQHFYCAVLGLEPVTLPSTFTHATRWFRRGRAELHLVGQADAAQAPGDPPTHRAGERDHSRTRHLAFAVADVEGAIETLQAHGILIVLGPRPRGDGATQLFCYDPDGHLVELHTLPPTADPAAPIAPRASRRNTMARPVTLFTGQWADLPLEKVAEKVAAWGFDGLELAGGGAHFAVQRARHEPDYVQGRWEILNRHGLKCYAISTHLVGQAVCDPIDPRHGGILPPHVWGDGQQAGVQQRAAQEVMDTARAAAKFGVQQVNGFTGSPIWHQLYSFPPNDMAFIEQGYAQFAAAWNPIIDVFDAEGVKFGLEVHPTEIAYDFVTTRKALDAIGNRPGFGINFDPSHFAHQFLDSAAFVMDFADRIYHVHVKDSKRHLDGRSSILGSHLGFGDVRRGWDFVSPGHGDVDFEGLFRALNRIGYSGPLSIEWEDSGMDRDWGAPDALAFVRRTDFAPSNLAFDAAFQNK